MNTPNNESELDEILPYKIFKWADDRDEVKQKLTAYIKEETNLARIDEHRKILTFTEQAHEYEQAEQGSGIQLFDDLRLGRMNELKPTIEK